MRTWEKTNSKSLVLIFVIFSLIFASIFASCSLGGDIDDWRALAGGKGGEWEEKGKPITGSMGITMMWVPGGCFELGREIGGASSVGDTEPISTVTQTGFYMSKFEVTQEQYMAVMGINPSYFNGDNGREPAPGEMQEQRPVDQVTWHEAIVFCNRLSKLESLTPAYTIDGDTDPDVWIATYGEDIGSWNAGNKWNFVEIIPGSIGYRLPTEAQWEYAAKGGNTGEKFTYSGSDDPNMVAWYYNKTGTPTDYRTHQVGLLQPNGLGLYDMSGNVWEWCWDWHGDYTVGEKKDPAGVISGIYRVMRGGNWYVDNVSDLRSVNRNKSRTDYRDYRVCIGIRLVRPSPDAPPAIGIYIQPAATTKVTEGGISGSLSVAANATLGASLSYQWYSSAAASNSSGSPIGGATSAEFAIPPELTAGIYYYFCEARAGGGAVPVRSNVATVKVGIISQTGIEMVWVPGGSFDLGKEIGNASTYGNDEPVSKVTLTGFKMGKYLVTQKQYMAVMSDGNPGFINPSYFTVSPEGNRDNLPVEQVSWYDAIVFCNKLSAKESLTSAYEMPTAANSSIWSKDTSTWGTVPASYSDNRWNSVRIVPGSNGYRLPTEAQWEYAAKGGATPDNTTYAGSDNPNMVAWYNGKTGTPTNSSTHEVGLLQPNSLELCDMSGNLWEWCWDWHSDYTVGDKIDPTGPLSGTERLERGGGYLDLVERLRLLYRDSNGPGGKGNDIGFRVVRP